MYRDTEHNYRDWTVDVYQANGLWVVEFWKSNSGEPTHKRIGQRRKELVAAAHRMIDLIKALEDLDRAIRSLSGPVDSVPTGFAVQCREVLASVKGLPQPVVLFAPGAGPGFDVKGTA